MIHPAKEKSTPKFHGSLSFRWIGLSENDANFGAAGALFLATCSPPSSDYGAPGEIAFHHVFRAKTKIFPFAQLTPWHRPGSGHQDVEFLAQLVNIEGLVNQNVHVHLRVGFAESRGEVR